MSCVSKPSQTSISAGPMSCIIAPCTTSQPTADVSQSVSQELECEESHDHRWLPPYTSIVGPLLNGREVRKQALVTRKVLSAHAIECWGAFSASFKDSTRKSLWRIPIAPLGEIFATYDITCGYIGLKHYIFWSHPYKCGFLHVVN